MGKFGERSLKNLIGVAPSLCAVLHEAIKDSPVDFTITDGGRTEAQQFALFLKGRDPKTLKVVEPREVVTNCDGKKRRSNHQEKADGFYHAVDLYPYVNGSVMLNNCAAQQRLIASHIKLKARALNVPIVWGGDWKGSLIDMPHFELKAK